MILAQRQSHQESDDIQVWAESLQEMGPESTRLPLCVPLAWGTMHQQQAQRKNFF